MPAFGDPAAWLGIVGLAPGLHGAHRTGRPFTGDHAGVILFDTLARHGLAAGRYEAAVTDTLKLDGAIILNGVKCLPPDNKPSPSEVATCRRFLNDQIAALPNLRVLVALGRIAHDSVVRLFDAKPSANRFSHGAVHRLPPGSTEDAGLVLVDSYHCSRYNTNTGRLTAALFDQVFEAAWAAAELSASGISGTNSASTSA